MTSILRARPIYEARRPPNVWDAGWLMTEHQRVAAAIYAPSTRTITATSPVLDLTVRTTDTLLLVDASGGTVTIPLPDANRLDAITVSVKKVDSSTNTVTLTGTVDGTVNPTLSAQWKTMTITASGGSWYLLSSV